MMSNMYKTSILKDSEIELLTKNHEKIQGILSQEITPSTKDEEEFFNIVSPLLNASASDVAKTLKNKDLGELTKVYLKWFFRQKAQDEGTLKDVVDQSGNAFNTRDQNASPYQNRNSKWSDDQENRWKE